MGLHTGALVISSWSDPGPLTYTPIGATTRLAGLSPQGIRRTWAILHDENSGFIFPILLKWLQATDTLVHGEGGAQWRHA
jgi:hypothetical protein